jgi:hypothetical protein
VSFGSRLKENRIPPFQERFRLLDCIIGKDAGKVLKSKRRQQTFPSHYATPDPTSIFKNNPDYPEGVTRIFSLVGLR